MLSAASPAMSMPTLRMLPSPHRLVHLLAIGPSQEMSLTPLRIASPWKNFRRWKTGCSARKAIEPLGEFQQAFR